MKRLSLFVFIALLTLNVSAIERQKINFDASWLMNVGDTKDAYQPSFVDTAWEKVTLPHAFNEKEAFRVSIENLTDTIIWYRKHFNIPETKDRKFFIEFEGVRFGADVWLNGKKVGYSDNGVMAFGFDLTPYIIKGENVIAVRCDNSWHYHERTTGSTFQWNDKNFNANYGGISKRVWLHVTGKLYQTLPLYSSLKTTGTYVYGTDYDIKNKAVTVNVESQVRNDDSMPRSFTFYCKVLDIDGKEVGHFNGGHYTLQPGETSTVKVSGRLHDVHFWSWRYGYLYTVKCGLAFSSVGQSISSPSERDRGEASDVVTIRTGFRKTHFGEGKIWLNDRIMMVHGYAQRTSNEWPGLGIDVPEWLSDYSNHLMVESGGNLVRWMHVCPSKQDIESCDRVGLPEAMPAGDAEKDVTGRRWEQRVELMRDAIIYNRNNPSILFYECGNKGISREHMLAMKAVRDEYDPHGGRAIGAREMLDIDEAEYGGEMLYINKSKRKPMWSMEYCRDEGLRKYWDEYSYPFHKEGDGPLYRGKPAIEYNHNMDEMAKVLVKSWNDYYLERPGTGKRVSSGGVKIVFSDTNTHHRGELNYRTSGVVDAMRIPKDGFYAHKVMWDGWVNPEKDHTYIVGHWNYDDGTVKPVYVVSTGDSVRLLVNGKDQGAPIRTNTFLFTFPKVKFEAGKIEAMSYHKSQISKLKSQIYKETSRYSIETAGAPDHLKLTAIQDPQGFKADGSDVALIQFEVVDKQGRRCPLDNRLVTFKLSGEGEWIGGIGVRKEERVKSKEERVKSKEKRVKSKEERVERKKGRVERKEERVKSKEERVKSKEERVKSKEERVENKEGRVESKEERELSKAQRQAAGLLDASDTENTSDNYIGSKALPVECGVNRVIVRSTPVAGAIHITASAEGLKPVSITLNTLPDSLSSRYSRGDAPSLSSGEGWGEASGDASSLSFREGWGEANDEIDIVSATAGSNEESAQNSFDDNERTEWKSDGKKENAWITYKLAKKSKITEITLKLTGWRSLRYPLAVYEGNKKVWEGITEPSLGYVHIYVDKPIASNKVKIQMLAPATTKKEVGDTKELAGGKASEMDRITSAKGKVELRIVEVDLLHRL